MYALESYDNLTIPGGLAHAAFNISTSRPAVFFGAIPTTEPVRTPVEQFFSRRRMPDAAPGQEGGERLTRHRGAARYAVGEHMSCIDFFNGERVPGVAMSGGWVEIAPGGRQPLHAHDCDAVVAVVAGRAACALADGARALDAGAMLLLPQGRVLSIGNESDGPTVVLWVCASEKPGRRIERG